MKDIHNFLKGINLKANVIVRLEFDLAYYDFAIKNVSNYTTRTSPI